MTNIAERTVTNPETKGPSPKAVIAGALPLIAGIVLLLLDKLVLDDSIDDSVWQTMLGLSPVIGGAAAAAKPGHIVEKVVR